MILFEMLLASLAFFSILICSVVAMFLVLFNGTRFPSEVSTLLTIFSFCMLCLAFSSSANPLVLILFNSMTFCWGLISINNQLRLTQ